MSAASTTRIARASAAVAGLLGSIALTGWLLNLPGLTRISPSWVPMKANTAVGLIASAIALALSLRGGDGGGPTASTGSRARERTSRGIALFVALLGVATFLEYVLKVDLRIDELLFREAPGAISTSRPGRMAFISTLCFASIGVAVAVVFVAPRVAHALSLLVLMVSSTATLGYLFGVEMLVAGMHPHMAVHTALAFNALAIGVLATRTEQSFLDLFVSRGAGGRLLRQALPLAILVVVTLARFRVHAQRAGWISSEVASSLLALVNSIAITTVLWMAARTLDREETERREAQAALVQLERARAEDLRREVEARTRELAHSNRDLHAAKERAESAARAKSQFLANMSHEIRTPLTAVLGFSDLLLDPGLAETDRRNYLLTIRRNGSHLLAVINDVLDLSKIDAGEMAVEKIACSPALILDELAALMRPRATEKGLDFGVELATPIPATIATDPTRMRQILINLVSNAIKFTERGRVRVVARVAGKTLVLEVVDSGIGIGAEQLGHLFRPFRQADPSLTRRFGGTGLGLAISQPLALALGGSVDVVSEAGVGSIFTLRLPLEEVDGPMITSVSQGESLVEPGSLKLQASELLSGTILLAEDGLDNQILLTRILAQLGLTVAVADNGRRAVELALAAETDGRPFALVLMDMQMPELDGYSAASLLRSAAYPRPIVALTAHAMAGERERCLAAGCSEYLTKPVNRAALLGALRRHVSREGSAPSPIHSSMSDDPELSEIIGPFVARTRLTAAKLRHALERAELSSLRLLAHQLKGASAGYGFPQLGEAANMVEAAIEHGLEAARPAIEDLIALCERLEERPTERVS